MKNLITLLILSLLTACGGGGTDDSSIDSINRSSQPNPYHKSRLRDVELPYFTQGSRTIQIVKQFEFRYTNAHYRGIEFHYGTILAPNEKIGDGRGCAVLQSLQSTDLGPILKQNLLNSAPIFRDELGDEIPDDFYFSGIKLDFGVVGSGWLYCYRHESLGPVTLDDFKQHFAGYIEFN